MTQGVEVPQDLKGNLKGSLFVGNGVLQAISVISFGRSLRSETPNSRDRLTIIAFVCRRGHGFLALLLH